MSEYRQKDEKIVEDGPKMQSVALHAVPAMPMARSIGPLEGKAAPQQALGTRLLQLQSTSRSASKEATPVVTTVWDVVSAPAVPSMYFFERTHVCIADGTPVHEIAERVALCLRKESIAATFNGRQVRLKGRWYDDLTQRFTTWMLTRHPLSFSTEPTGIRKSRN